MPRPVPVRTLAELGPRFLLMPYCPACYRSGRRLSYAWLLSRYDADVELEAIRRWLRCAACGCRDCRLYRGWDAGGFHHGGGAE